MGDTKPNRSVISLKINGLNILSKRKRLSGWFLKTHYMMFIGDKI